MEIKEISDRLNMAPLVERSIFKDKYAYQYLTGSLKDFSSTNGAVLNLRIVSNILFLMALHTYIKEQKNLTRNNTIRYCL